MALIHGGSTMPRTAPSGDRREGSDRLLSVRSLLILLVAACIGVCVGLTAGAAVGSPLAGLGAGILAGLTAAASLNSLVES